MSNSFLYPVKSNPATQFVQALAKGAATPMNLVLGVPAIAARRFLIRAIEVLAMENFGPEVNYFATAAGLTASPATDTFLARFGFLSAMGEQLGGAGLWRYYVDGLAIPHYDLDTIATLNPPALHIVLQNIDATAKSADAAGATAVTTWLEPMQAW